MIHRLTTRTPSLPPLSLLSPSPTWCLRGCGATPRESHPASFSGKTCVFRPAALQRLFLKMLPPRTIQRSRPVAAGWARRGAGNKYSRRSCAPQNPETEEPGNGEQSQKSAGKLYNPPLTKTNLDPDSPRRSGRFGQHSQLVSLFPTIAHWGAPSLIWLGTSSFQPPPCSAGVDDIHDRSMHSISPCTLDTSARRHPSVSVSACRKKHVRLPGPRESRKPGSAPASRAASARRTDSIESIHPLVPHSAIGQERSERIRPASACKAMSTYRL